MQHIHRKTEQGFVLITAMWLLLLCGSLVAFLMLKSAGASNEVKRRSLAVQARFDADAAVETIMADIIFRGPASLWAQIPARGSIDIGGRTVDVAIDSENSRLDLNDADLAIIDRTLLGRVSARKRLQLVGALQQARARGRINNWAEAASLLAPLLEEGRCAEGWFTLYSGLSKPEEAEGSGGKAEEYASQTGSRPVRPGEALRLRVTSGDVSSQTIVRIFGTRDHAFGTLSWSNGHPC